MRGSMTTTWNAVERARTALSRGAKVREERAVTIAPKSFDKEARSAEFVCSTETIDRYGSIIRQSWLLDAFKANPIALFGHSSGQPIGTWQNLRVEKKQLVGTLVFAKDDPIADKCLNLVEQGVLRAVSVGFIPNTYKFEKHSGEEVVVYEDNDLLEVSLVSIPANPEALARELPPPTPSAAPPIATQPQLALEERGDTGKASAIKLAASAEGRAQAAEQRATAAERRAQEAEARAAKLDGDLAAEKKARESADAARTAAEAERDAQKKRADGLDDERIVKKVDATIGKKFDPVHRDKLLAKCRKDEADFDEMVAMTADLPTEVGKRVVDPKDPEPSDLDPKDAVKRLREMAKARAKEENVPLHVAMSLVRRDHPEFRALWPSPQVFSTIDPIA